MTQMIEMSVACPDRETALEIGRKAVAARLVACANVSGPVTSVFHWQGAVEEETEVMLWLKSRAELAEQLAALVRDAHPYDLPAITWEPRAADAATRAWLEAETSGGE